MTVLTISGCAEKPASRQIENDGSGLTISLEGTVFPKEEYKIFSQVTGEIDAILKKPGDTVLVGDIIASFDRYLSEHEISRLKTQIEFEKQNIAVVGSKNVLNARDTVSAANAKHTLDKISDLYEHGSASSFELREAQNKYAAALAQSTGQETVVTQMNLNNLESQLEVAKYNNEKMIIRAPINGIISAMAARKGKIISQNEEIATVINIDKVIVKAGLASGLLPYVNVGQKIKIGFVTTPPLEVNATVTKIIPVVDEQFGRMTIEAELPNPNYQLQVKTKCLVTLYLSDEMQQMLKKNYMDRKDDKQVNVRSTN